MNQQLKLYTLGGLQVKLGDQVVSELGTTKAEVLLVYLCNLKRPIAREILAEMFWEDRTLSRALSNLRVALAALRKPLGEFLQVERDTVVINPVAEVWVDALELEARLKAVQDVRSFQTTETVSEIASAVELYHGAFLEGIFLRGAREAEAWLEREREHIQRLIIPAISNLIDFHLQQGEYAAGIRFAERQLALDPLNEAAHRGLMALLAGGGQRAAALAQYETCRELLVEELAVEPDPQTTALYNRIQAGDLAAGHTPAKVQPIKTELPQFLHQEAAQVTPEPVFVGRQEQLASLAERLEQSLVGSGGVMFVTGGPGRGKTALLGAFARQALQTHPQLVVAQGLCNAFAGAGDPYLPFRQVLAMLCGDVEGQWLAGEVSTEQAWRLWQGVPETAQALLAHGKTALQLLVDGVSLAERLKAADNGNAHLASQVEACLAGTHAEAGQANQTALQEQTRAVLRTVAAQHPLLLLIDDLQWADRASLNLLFHLGRGIAGTPVLILGAYRPEEVQAVGAADEQHPLARLLPEFKRQYGEIWLDLGAVSESEGRAFVNAYLETEPNALTDAFQEELFQHTGGHPLFTVELLRDLQERGDLVRDERGAWVQKADLDWSQLPPRVEGVIEAHLGRLDGGLKKTLEVASVEGEQFTLQVLTRVQGLTERELLAQLNRQLDQGHRLVRPTGIIQVDGERLYNFQFRHALYQQHMHRELPESERELLHVEVGRALEEIYADRLEEAAPRLAQHFLAGGQADRAVPYLLLAGDQALRLYAHQEAAEFYRQAVDVLTAGGQLKEAASTLLKLGQTYHIAFAYQAAREAYERAFALWQQIGGHSARLKPAQQPLRMAFSEFERINYYWQHTFISLWYLNLIFSGLVDYYRAEYPSPGLARTWQVSPDGRRYTFTLRQDARWSDGQPVTAEDFAFAWKLRLDPHKSPFTEEIRSIYQVLYTIKGAREFHRGLEADPDTVAVRALDDFTLEVELVQPNSYFLQKLRDLAFLPIPRHCMAQHGPAWNEPGKLVSNGPFSVQDWRPGQSMRLRRNPHYYGEFPGNLEAVEIKLVPDMRSSEVLAMYAQDEVDVVNLGSETLHNRDHFPGEYIQQQANAIYYLGVNILRSPLGDRQVRRALGLAIDKQALTDQALGGWLAPATGGFLPPGIPGHSPEIGLPYDPDQARRLLAQAGFPDGRDFPILTMVIHHNNRAAGEYLQRQWADVLKVGLQIRTTKDLIALLKLAKETDLFWYGWYPYATGDPESFLGEGIFDHPSFADWDHPGYHRTLTEARQCQDQQQRLQFYQQADRILIDEAIAIPLGYLLEHWLAKPWVRNWDYLNLSRVILEAH